MIDKVRIGNKVYSVELTKAKLNGDTDLFGEINHTTQQIFLLEDATAEQQEETFLHEVLHGLDVFMRIGLEEKQVEQLAAGLRMLQHDNTKETND